LESVSRPASELALELEIHPASESESGLALASVFHPAWESVWVLLPALESESVSASLQV
jgi:hypothetical protein